MRTNIDIDDALLSATMKETGLRSKKETVNEGLKSLLRVVRQRRALEEMRGIGWEGDLDEMRNDWTPATDWDLDRR